MVSVVTHARPIWHSYAAGAAVLLGTVVAFEASDLTNFAAVSGMATGLWLTAMVLRTRRLYVDSVSDELG